MIRAGSLRPARSRKLAEDGAVGFGFGDAVGEEYFVAVGDNGNDLVGALSLRITEAVARIVDYQKAARLDQRLQKTRALRESIERVFAYK